MKAGMTTSQQGSDDSRAVAEQLRELAGLAERVAGEHSVQIAELAGLVYGTLTSGGKLLFCGNGGSAADSQHLATEYVVRFRRNRQPFAAISLTTDTSLLTAASNDYGFDRVFELQVRAHGRAGDVLFLHSTSGVSANLLAAARAASELGIVTVALLARGGGPLRDLVDRSIVVPTDLSARAQEIHICIGHIVCDLVEARLAVEAGQDG